MKKNIYVTGNKY